MSAKHTPGPRRIEQAGIGSNAHYRVIDHNGNFVAKTYSHDEALCIAAAPDLLTACGAAEDLLVGVEGEPPARAAETNDIHRAINLLRAAIAKATSK